MTPLILEDKRLWHNKYIKVNKKELVWRIWSQKGIQIIHDILDEHGNFLTNHDLEQKYNFNCNFLQYNSLKDAIPKSWRDKLKEIKIPRIAISSDEQISVKINKQTIPLQNINNKLIYWKLIEDLRVTPVIKDKWIQTLNLDKN